MNTNEIRKICDEALANYNFGEGVYVEATSGWEYDSSSKEVSCPVFLSFDEDEEGQESHKATFTVVIENGKVIQADCSYEGNLIGNYNLV